MMSHINSYSRKKLGNRSPYEVFEFQYGKEILEAKDRRVAGPKAPAEGLTLMKIEIDESEPHYPNPAE